MGPVAQLSKARLFRFIVTPVHTLSQEFGVVHDDCRGVLILRTHCRSCPDEIIPGAFVITRHHSDRTAIAERLPLRRHHIDCAGTFLFRLVQFAGIREDYAQGVVGEISCGCLLGCPLHFLNIGQCRLPGLQRFPISKKAAYRFEFWCRFELRDLKRLSTTNSRQPAAGSRCLSGCPGSDEYRKRKDRARMSHDEIPHNIMIDHETVRTAAT